MGEEIRGEEGPGIRLMTYGWEGRRANGKPRGKADSWWVGNAGRGNEKGGKLRRKADLKDSRFKQFKQFGGCKLGSL